jgi:hypothetical protein
LLRDTTLGKGSFLALRRVPFRQNISIFGETALAVAVREGQESLVKLFISKGAKIDTRTTLEKLTPLESAHQRGYGKIARLLWKAKK